MIPHREVLKPDQEIELIQLAQAKPKTLESDRAFRTLIDHNQGLIVKIVKPFISDRQHLSFEDLMQEGNQGLTIAIQRFDLKRGLKLSTYATNWIYMCVTRAIANQDREIRLPLHIQERQRLIRKTVRALQLQTGKTPSLVAIATELGESVEWVAAAVQAEGLKYLTYLDAPTRDFEKKNADTSGLIDYIASDLDLPEDLVDLILLRDRLEAAIAQLPDAQAKAVRLRFGLDDRVARSQSEAALILGCSKGYTATLQAKAIKSLKQLLIGKELLETPPQRTNRPRRHDKRADQTRKKIEQAIAELSAEGGRFTIIAVCSRAGVSKSALQNYPDLTEAARAAIATARSKELPIAN